MLCLLRHTDTVANKFLKCNILRSCSVLKLKEANLEFLDSNPFLGQFMKAYLPT